MAFDQTGLVEIVASVLLFFLVFGMSASVDVMSIRTQLENRTGIAIGLFLQFIFMPFLGFSLVQLLKLDHPTGLTLLVITTSPGGSYSNWWCSIFNGDLALSVAMTGVSTLASSIFLPLNIFVYSRVAFDEDIVQSLDWTAVIVALTIVITAIACGLSASATFGRNHSKIQNFHLNANRLGNAAGLMLLTVSAILSNMDKQARLWHRDWSFYVGIGLPCLLSLVLANLISTGVGMVKPERVTVSIESCYQNVGIATSVALSMFEGADQSEAVGVPFYYGLVEASLLLIYCIGAWKAGWTKAPADVPCWQMATTSYDIIQSDRSHDAWDETTPTVTIGKDDTKLATDSEFCYVDQDEEAAVKGKTTDAASAPEEQAYYKLPS